ncbi:beta-glucosidase [Bifidobacterium dolichotidis]|uniref:beta-N-acetylhexosaminidase n=1 Tax=Bifidobacterium dolichotidis TaxID=2306976 RepID=A0A430FSP5_9BIFI|nr:glycoside hydrolase family 3 N-terminal domain-containing protein [Bifidobacterium dolichotidis]RSX55847.1 beta-glucosidase [Bifidobacterium dolichotidis]
MQTPQQQSVSPEPSNSNNQPSKQPNKHPSKRPKGWMWKNPTDHTNPLRKVVIAIIACIAVLAIGLFCWITLEPYASKAGKSQNMTASNGNGYNSGQSNNLGESSQQQQDSLTDTLSKELSVQPQLSSDQQQARKAVNAMSIEQQAGQLVMAPLKVDAKPEDLKDLIQNQHLGSILLLGNWTSGVSGVRQATTTLQQYSSAQNPLFMAADQEGGLIQHLKGPGFTQMPSALEQGKMSVEKLTSEATTWGQQLRQAGINIDLAPCIDTVSIDRDSNDPIGALDRDFGLGAEGNARHGVAFVEGMRKANIGATIKHYPGLGAVSGNTDFTEEGIDDVTTTVNSDQLNAFKNAIEQSNPAMVMISLSTYKNLDATQPAVFSHYIVTDLLRNQTRYNGVIISDSMSAAALNKYEQSELGTKFIEAGGDLACIGDVALVKPVLDGIVSKAKADKNFAKQVQASAERVMTLKYEMNMIS